MKVVGLSSQPELNGEKVEVVKFDAEQNRYVVKVLSTGKGKAIKVENLELQQTWWEPKWLEAAPAPAVDEDLPF